MGATSIGAGLRAARIRQGRSLGAIAVETRIGRPILEALEADRFDSIPGGSYKRSFLRQYARALGLNEEEVIEAFRHQYDEAPLPLPVPPIVPHKSHFKPTASFFMAAAAMLGLYKLSELGNQERKFTAAAPVAIPAVAPPVQGQASRSAPATPAAVDETHPAATESRQEAPVRVAFTATEPVWISVRCDGNLSYTGMLAASETKTFEASGAVTVLAGNAGGLVVTINGNPVGSIGAHGETRLIEFTPGGVRKLPRRVTPPPVDSDES